MCGRIRARSRNKRSGDGGSTPDYFSATGQLWGNPVYNWEKLQQLDFQWWVQRFQAMLDYIDIIRIDHFRGFQAWGRYAETTAMNGEWIEAPGEAFSGSQSEVRQATRSS